LKVEGLGFVSTYISTPQHGTERRRTGRMHMHVSRMDMHMHTNAWTRGRMHTRMHVHASAQARMDACFAFFLLQMYALTKP
jgi:hypothetical protein